MGQQTYANQPPTLDRLDRDRLDRDPSGPQIPPRPSWTPLLVSASATVLLIALLAGLLVAQATRRAPTSASAPTATAGATTTPASAGQWQSIDAYTHVAGLLLAPSDPRTAYQSLLVASKGAPTTLTLQRTRDAGASWQSVSLPSRLKGVSPDSYESPPSFAISPLDANRVYLTVAAHLPSCPNRIGQERAGAARTAPQPSGPLCFTQYVSSDGGATWRDLSLPQSGLLGAPRPQENRLWALISPPFLAQDTTAPAGRLARSADGGGTWTLADGGLPSSVGITDFMPAPAGATVFVVTDRADRFNSGMCQGCLPPPDYKLWRSDDLGAHWTQVSALPYQGIGGLAVTKGANGAPPEVYLQVFTDTQGTLALAASGDGGRAWAPAPNDGLQAGSAQGEGIAGVLADGSVIETYAPGGSATRHALYAWKPGDSSWRALAPELPSIILSQLILGPPAADGSQTLTLLYQDENGNRVATIQV